MDGWKVGFTKFAKLKCKMHLENFKKAEYFLDSQATTLSYITFIVLYNQYLLLTVPRRCQVLHQDGLLLLVDFLPWVDIL